MELVHDKCGTVRPRPSMHMQETTAQRIDLILVLMADFQSCRRVSGLPCLGLPSVIKGVNKATSDWGLFPPLESDDFAHRLSSQIRGL